MTKEEAIKEMESGKKVTHAFFAKDEWMTMKDGKIVTKEGYKHNAREFWYYRQVDGWKEGYSLYVA